MTLVDLRVHFIYDITVFKAMPRDRNRIFVRFPTKINHNISRISRRRNVVNHRSCVIISPHLMACINRMQRGEDLCMLLRMRPTCISSRVNDIITLIRAGALGPGVQSEFVAGTENWAWHHRAA